MAATNHTSSLQLNQWVRTDPFCMDDFNEDNRKIDAAIAAADSKIDSTKAALKAEIDKKQNKITGAISSCTGLNFKPERIIGSDKSGKLRISELTMPEAEKLCGIQGPVQEQLNARLRVETGSYTGSGTKGAANPTSLSLGLKPMLVYIFSSHQLFMALRGMDMALCRFIPSSTSETSNSVQDTSDFTTWRCSVTWSSSGLSWYTGISGNYPMYQFNVSGDEYHYLAIGT